MAGKSLAEYAAEAKRDPFELPVDAKTTIVIQPPTVEQLLAIEDAPDTRTALRAITGDQFTALMRALKGQPAPVLAAIVEDMRKHFGLGN